LANRKKAYMVKAFISSLLRSFQSSRKQSHTIK